MINQFENQQESILFFRQCLVRVRVVFLLDCSLVLPLLKHKDVRALLEK